MPRKKPVAQAVKPQVVVAQPQDTTYPEPTTQEALYAASLLPQNSLPADQTLQDVANHNALPLAILVLASGEVLPPPIPYTKNVLTQALHTQAEVDQHRAAYESAETARVEARLASNAQVIADPITPPEDDGEPEDDMYGEPMSEAVATAFPSLKD